MMGPEARTLTEQPVSRQVFSVQDLEIRDRLASSMMNKFLYLYFSKEMPRKAHSNMVHESPTLQIPCCLDLNVKLVEIACDMHVICFYS